MEIKASEIKEIDWYSANDGSCAYCEMWKGKIKELEQYVKVNYIYTNTDKGMEMATKKGVRNIPQLFVGDVNFVGTDLIGKVVHGIIKENKVEDEDTSI